MAGEGLEERLRRLLGLSGYEARVYLAVLGGASRPREIAEEAGVPPQRIYDVLRSLQRRGLVVQTGEGYKATPPARALGAEAERLIVEARLRADELRALAQELERHATSTAREHVAVEEGLSRALAAAMAALQECSEKPWVLAYKAAEKAEELLPALSRLLEVLDGRGARVILYTGAAVPEHVLRTVASIPGVELRASDAVLLDMMVVCDTVVIGVPGRGGNVVAVAITNREFADALKRRLETIWRSARPVPDAAPGQR
ncbi:TrmB family transcriptional regulator [Pyrodictium abyssi]|uniref:Transcription regulator TrmB N-terminal domain-containing protein n=1 Tax=Pyrodictium abyssi TaxID=54256 RepID=A0ABM8IXR8_9CREN|nr:hypothetical protein PABY_18920 [Pyrodictium abyssi]